jgi:ribosomal-protein-alanine N-acetyltransferase
MNPVQYKYEDCLETPRLKTRWLNMNDVNTWTEFMDDRIASEFFQLSGFANAQEKAVYWIERQVARYRENRFGLQALTEKSSGEFIGQCGLLLQEIDGKTELEVGYHILRKHWGKGFAPEAAKRFIEYAYTNKLSDSVTSIIHVNNLRSQRVADKNGLKREKQCRWNDKEVFLYRIARSQWNA